MANFLTDLMTSEPRSLETLRDSLVSDRTQKKDFIDILEDHHDYLEESISVLLNHETTDLEKQTSLARFLSVLDMHAKAEQETLYVALKEASDKMARIEGFFGKDEHEIADKLAAELKGMGFDISWSEEIDAKAKVIAGLVKSHIKEEESEMFPLTVKVLPYEKMNALAKDYLEKCERYLVTDNQIPPRISPNDFPTISY